MSSQPLLSLIVATRDRPASLSRLLSKLEFLSERGWELIVVDNGSVDIPPELREKIAKPAYVRIVRESRRGKGNALNTGVESARGDLLVFTDDDGEPEPSWLDELLAASYRHPDADVFGGKILANSESIPNWIRRSRNLQEILLSEHDLGNLEKHYPPSRFPLGPNMAVRRRALAGVISPFDPTMGPGSRLPVGDEACFFYRIHQGGGRRRVYVPLAVVYHRIEGRDLKLLTALRRCFRGGFSAGLLQTRFPEQMEAEAHPSNAFKILSETKSWRELACATLRATGFLFGAMRRPSGTGIG